ncbi:PP2C family protein-serine/threonine phosphatase [Actinacidiphila acidipaludis]|nr:SpoIIE family protein phosphatase [Streptomyces acidipaludis]
MEDSAFAAAVKRLLDQGPAGGPEQLADLVRRTAQAMGLNSAVVFLADLQQRDLVPLPGSRDNDGMWSRPLGIEDTLAGRAYRTTATQSSQDGPAVLWLPLVDGRTRIGVMRAEADEATAEVVDWCRALASATALLVASQATHSDELIRLTRSRPMRVAAEMVWAFLPPTTIGNGRVTSTGLLEPAYQVAGDAFDHALTSDTLHLTLVDAMGHDLASGQSSAVALAGCRATRRAGGSLAEIVTDVDKELAEWVPGRMLTGIFADLDLATGTLEWINCGHPPPLLLRGHHIVSGALERTPVLPLGLGPRYPREHTSHRFALRPGDRILLHTDGLTEARSPAGEIFGDQRLADFVTRAASSGESAQETARRLLHAILDYHQHQLRDDAALLIAEWHPGS